MYKIFFQLYPAILLFFIIETLSLSAKAQDTRTDSLMHEYLRTDSLVLAELSSDSLSILDFLDSLMNKKLEFSTLSGRLGYTSNITNAGRDYGVQQYGLSAGISYYHKSGFYGDLSGYWNSDANPRINPLVGSLGFMYSDIPHFSVTAFYDHYFYFQGNDSLPYKYPFTNSLNLSPYLDLKFLSIGVNYSFLFGNENAHRIRPDIYLNLSIKNIGIIRKIQFLPGASIYLGNQDVVAFSNNFIDLKKFISEVGISRFRQLYKRYGKSLLNYVMQEQVTNEFGIMNYNFSVPVNIYFGSMTLSLSYFYNIPVALPGEQIDITPNSFFSTSLLYTFPFYK